MSDLISRHGVSAWLSNMGHDKLADMVMDEKRFPSAETKTGEWNRLSHDTFHCKLCGRTFIVMQGDDAMNYCPNCGSYNGG